MKTQLKLNLEVGFIYDGFKIQKKTPWGWNTVNGLNVSKYNKFYWIPLFYAQGDA